MTTNKTWQELYDMAKATLHPAIISQFVEAGEVAAAILTEAGNVYTGVCIDTSCSLGMCAERNAVANMITNRESKIVRLVCVLWDGKILSPCGVCREALKQLHPDSGDMEILLDLEGERVIKLKELIPDWWAQDRL